MCNKKGFTLSEMLVVLFIISSLMFLIVPNVIDTKESVEIKSCDVYKELVQSQLEAYKVNTGVYATTLDELVTAKYIKSNTCPSGVPLTINNGIVEEAVPTEPVS